MMIKSTEEREEFRRKKFYKPREPDEFDIFIDKCTRAVEGYEARKLEQEDLDPFGTDPFFFWICNYQTIFFCIHFVCLLFFPLLFITIPLHIMVHKFVGGMSREINVDRKEMKRLMKLAKKEDEEFKRELAEVERERQKAIIRDANDPSRYCDYVEPYVFNPSTLKFDIIDTKKKE